MSDPTRECPTTDAGWTPCRRCEQTGNELRSMWRLCTHCFGVGWTHPEIHPAQLSDPVHDPFTEDVPRWRCADGSEGPEYDSVAAGEVTFQHLRGGSPMSNRELWVVEWKNGDVWQYRKTCLTEESAQNFLAMWNDDEAEYRYVEHIPKPTPEEREEAVRKGMSGEAEGLLDVLNDMTSGEEPVDAINETLRAAIRHAISSLLGEGES